MKKETLVTPGIHSLSLEIPNTSLSIPMTLLQGKTPGKTGLISTGIHSNEYVGIETGIRLSREIPWQNLQGRLFILHPVNLTGFQSMDMDCLVPEDKKNLNRVFPGNKEGSLSEQIACHLVETFFPKIHFLIDLHGGAVQEALHPHVYFTGGAKEEVVKASLSMARHTSIPYLVRSKSLQGGFYTCAALAGIPSLLLERGGRGLWKKEEVDQNLEDIKNILRHLALLQDSTPKKESTPLILEDLHYEVSTWEGCWYPCKAPGDKVRLGEPLGEIKDYHGNLLETLYCKKDGVLLYQICALPVHLGNEVLVYG